MSYKYNNEWYYNSHKPNNIDLVELADLQKLSKEESIKR